MAPEPTVNPNLSADATSLEAAQANVLASSTAMAANLNANLRIFATGAFNNWASMVNAGRIPNTNPPQIPKSFIVVADLSGWAFPAQSGPPVLPPFPIPPDRSASGIGGAGQAALDEYALYHRGMDTAHGETPDSPPVGTRMADPATGIVWVKTLVGATPWGRAIEWRRA